MSYRSGGADARLVSKQAAVASVVFVAVQTMLFDDLGSSCQRCCDGRMANVWQRPDGFDRTLQTGHPCLSLPEMPESL